MIILNKISLNIGSGVYQIPLIKKLKSLKYKVISTDINPYSPGLKFADIKFVTDSYDYQRLTIKSGLWLAFREVVKK